MVSAGVNGGSFVISPESGLDVQCSALHGTKCPNLRLGLGFFAFFFFKMRCVDCAWNSLFLALLPR